MGYRHYQSPGGVEIAINTRGLDPGDLSTVALIGLVTRRAVITRNGAGCFVLSFWVPFDNVVDGAIVRIRELRAAIPWVEFDGVAQDVVGVDEIARRLGVSRRVVEGWACQATFPRGRWTWVRVVDWLRGHRPWLVGGDVIGSIPFWDEVVEIEMGLAGLGGGCSYSF